MVPKTYLPNYREFYEKRQFTAGRNALAREVVFLGALVPFGNDLVFGAAGIENFKLHVEMNCPAGANSGIYLRGIYEIQVAESYGKPLDPHNMGALYSRITPSVAAEKPIGEWQTFDITLVRRFANRARRAIRASVKP